MAFATINGGFAWPDHHAQNRYGVYTNNELAIDASGEQVGFIFEAPKTGNIDRVFARVVTKTTNGTLDVRLETVSATDGKPTGTLFGTNTNGSFSNTAGPQVIDVTLTAAAAVTKGDKIALVIVQAAGNCTIQGVHNTGGNAAGGNISRRTYVLHYTGGAWSNRNAIPAISTRPNMAIRYDDGSYNWIPGSTCLSTVAVSAFNNTSATRERGIAFTLPFPVTVAGWYAIANMADSDVDVVLANTSGTALATYAADKDLASYYFAGTTYHGTFMGLFGTPQELAASTKYYLTLKPGSASDIGLPEFSLLDTGIAGQMGMWNGGTACYLVTRDSGGTYTETTTQRPYGMGLLLSGFDDGAGGGGGTSGGRFIGGF